MDLHARLRCGVVDSVRQQMKEMRTRKISTFLVFSGMIVTLWGQSASMVIHVDPEASLNLSSIPLSSPVVNSGEVVVSPPVTVAARFGCCARILGRAKGGATAAACSGCSFSTDNFTGSSEQALITGWNQSGIAN